MKIDMTARRMLNMLDDPDQWEKDASSPEEDRERVLKGRLARVFLSAEDSYDTVLERLLDTVSLPHFEPYAFSRSSDKKSSKKSGAKLSVLD